MLGNKEMKEAKVHMGLMLVNKEIETACYDGCVGLQKRIKMAVSV